MAVVVVCWFSERVLFCAVLCFVWLPWVSFRSLRLPSVSFGLVGFLGVCSFTSLGVCESSEGREKLFLDLVLLRPRFWVLPISACRRFRSGSILPANKR